MDGSGLCLARWFVHQPRRQQEPLGKSCSPCVRSYGQWLTLPQAPDVHKGDDGKYYMYYSVSTLGSQNSVIGVASSTTMEPGSWTDHGSTGLSSDGSQGYNTIDANWIKIGDQQVLNFGSYWQGLYQIDLAGPLKIGTAAPVNIAYNATGQHAIEASFLYQQNGFYYLFFSSGKANGYDTSFPAQGEEYRINVCRSSTGRGDFVSGFGSFVFSSTLVGSNSDCYRSIKMECPASKVGVLLCSQATIMSTALVDSK